jgi:hypothetical protein
LPYLSTLERRGEERRREGNLTQRREGAKAQKDERREDEFFLSVSFLAFLRLCVFAPLR